MVQVWHLSEAGEGGENEDAFVVRGHPGEEGCLLVALADGQGGRAGGREAARVACAACVEVALGRSVKDLMRPGVWEEAGRAADGAVARAAGAGFTTLVAFAVYRDWLAGASSGDSAALMVNAGEEGVILTGGQVKDPPVGSGAAVFTPFGARLSAPWTALALSDGVWKYAGWEGVWEVARRCAGEEVAGELRRRAALRSGALADDFTVVVVKS
jgi:PPM family protein phosphatase